MFLLRNRKNSLNYPQYSLISQARKLSNREKDDRAQFPGAPTSLDGPLNMPIPLMSAFEIWQPEPLIPYCQVYPCQGGTELQIGKRNSVKFFRS